MPHITANNMKAVLAPELGGAVMSLRYEDQDIFRPAISYEAVAADPREAACYPCVPWFSRIFGGLDFAGEHYELAPTLPLCDSEHALHGHGWVNPWTVTDQEQNRLACRFEHAPAQGLFPFSFSATQDFTVTETGFKIILTLINTSCNPMPAGLGLHPFFPSTKTSELNFIEYFEQPKAPAKLHAPQKIDHCGPVTDDHVDYTVKQWRGAAQIIHDGMNIGLRSNARILHLYSPEKADFFCAEPVSHWPGHFGADILAPGESMDIFLALTIEQS